MLKILTQFKQKIMKPIFIFLFLITFLSFPITSSAQSNLKTEKVAEKEIRETIDLFFEGLYDGNLVKMEEAIWTEATLISTFVNKKGDEQTRTSTMKDFLEAASKIREDKWVEKIWDVEIESEGRLAQAIMQYAFFLNDEFVHCGANAMQFIKMDGQWKIVSLADTRMKKACDEAAIKKRFKK